VTTASLVITYNPAKVVITSVAQGSFLPNTLASAVLTSGKATFTYAAPADSGGKQGTGTVATLSLKPLTTGAFTLTFNTGTLVTAVGQSGNVLKTANPITLTPLIPGDLTETGDVSGDHVNIYDYNLLVTNYGNPYTIYDYNDLVTHYAQ